MRPRPSLVLSIALVLAVFASTCTGSLLWHHISTLPTTYHGSCLDPVPPLGPLCHRSLLYEIPFGTGVHIAHRRVWSGMRGGRIRSIALGRKYTRLLNNSNQFESGGAHDVALFLWTQMCMSGFPPHPGPGSDPETSTSTPTPKATSSSSPSGVSDRPFRYDASAKVLSLYDVVAHFRGSDASAALTYLTRLKDKPIWLTQGLATSHKFKQCPGRGTPILSSMEEVTRLVQVVQSSCGRGDKRLVKCQQNIGEFFEKYSHILDRIWPGSTVDKPKGATIHFTKSDPMTHLASYMGIHVVHTRTPGVFHTRVPSALVDTLVELVGVFTCTKFYSQRFSKRNGNGDQKHYFRYNCIRGSTRKCEGGKRSGVVSRPYCRTVKCSCVASITGTQADVAGTSSGGPAGGDMMVDITLDLRHTNHVPGTAVDALLLPLLPAVQKKLDMITKVSRNKIVIRRMVAEWLAKEYIPQTYPSLAFKTLHPLDGRFFPNVNNINNSITRAAKCFQHSAIDQESTFSYIASQSTLSWVMRPAQGDSTSYVHTPGMNSENHPLESKISSYHPS